LERKPSEVEDYIPPVIPLGIPKVVREACEQTCPIVQEQQGEQLAYFQEETSILFVSRSIDLSYWKPMYIPRVHHSASQKSNQKFFFLRRTHYKQIEGATKDRRSLLSDKRFQLFRGYVHVFSGLHDVQSEQRSIRKEHIRVSHLIRDRIEAVLRIGCLGNAKPPCLIISDIVAYQTIS